MFGSLKSKMADPVIGMLVFAVVCAAAHDQKALPAASVMGRGGERRAQCA